MTNGPLGQRLSVQAEAVARCDAENVRAGKRMVDAAMDRAVTIVTKEGGYQQRHGWVRHQCNQAALKAAREECGSFVGMVVWMLFQTVAWVIVRRWIDQLLLDQGGQET